MILVDTNAWISHLRVADLRLVRFLRENRVATCDVVLGELRLGAGLPKALTTSLALLPRLPCPTATETLHHLDRHRRTFRGSGVGWADTQIIVTAADAGAPVYSSDRAVRSVWRKLGFRLP